MQTFFINDLIQLYCLRHISNNQVFIIKKTVQADLRYFIMHLYKQSSRWQDVFNAKHPVRHTHTDIYIYNNNNKGKVIPLQARCGPEGG